PCTRQAGSAPCSCATPAGSSRGTRAGPCWPPPAGGCPTSPWPPNSSITAGWRATGARTRWPCWSRSTSGSCAWTATPTCHPSWPRRATWPSSACTARASGALATRWRSWPPGCPRCCGWRSRPTRCTCCSPTRCATTPWPTPPSSRGYYGRLWDDHRAVVAHQPPLIVARVPGEEVEGGHRGARLLAQDVLVHRHPAHVTLEHDLFVGEDELDGRAVLEQGEEAGRDLRPPAQRGPPRVGAERAVGVLPHV